MKSNSNKARIALVIGVVLLAAVLRGWAAMRLPTDFDEPIYLEAALDYGQAIRAGDWNGVIDYPGNREHPALVKLLYGLAVTGLGEDPSPVVAGIASRLLSAFFGTASVLVLGLVNPLGGALLAGHTMAVKYTAQVYLEALPHLASTVAVLAFARSAAARDRWYWLSAVALGATTAAKLSYLPVVVVIAYLALVEKRVGWRDLLLYGGTSVAIFYLLNPTLWHDPVNRTLDTLFFHLRYSQSSHVQAAGYPWYQPFIWITRSPPTQWHPDVFFYFGLDGIVSLVALGGVYWEWKQRRWVVVWIATGMLFLLVWPTKWPQYTLVLTPALCLAASTALSHAYAWFREQEATWPWLRSILPAPPRAFWVLLGVMALGIGIIYTASTLELTLGRLYWSQIIAQNTPLPSNTIYDLATGPEGRMALGTDRGAVIWSPSDTPETADRWTVLSTDNSSLPDNSVLAVAWDQSGAIWLGTEAGLARNQEESWQVYHAKEIGLMGDKVYDLAIGGDGRLWVATNSGVAVHDGGTWTPMTAERTGLLDNWVRSLAIDPNAAGDVVWFGSENGISRLEAATGEWTPFTAKELGVTFGGVAELLIDSEGQLWAATLGGGLGHYDGTSWHFLRTANSDIPFNTVTTIGQVGPDLLWVGVAPPAEAGGVLAEYDGENWHVHSSRNSGFSESEPLAIEVDPSGWRWIGTRTAGVDIYQPNQ